MEVKLMSAGRQVTGDSSRPVTRSVTQQWRDTNLPHKGSPGPSLASVVLVHRR